MPSRYCKLPLLLFLLPLILTGCSWLSELLLVNNTNETVVVRFSFNDSTCPQCDFHPKAYNIDKWNSDSVPSFGDTTSIVWRIESDSIYYVELPANKALVLAEDMNLDFGYEDHLARILNMVKKLEVLSPNDSVLSCSGVDCAATLIRYSRARAGIPVR